MMLKINAMAAAPLMVLASSADSFMPLLLVLVIGGAIVSVVFRVLINRGVNKGVDSVAQKKEMQKMQEKVERGENAEKYLRELYPEYQPNPKKPGVKNPLEALTEKPETIVSAPAAVSDRPVPSQDYTDRCCICGDPLESKYAILFQTADGREMRADRKCYEALYDLGTSEDVTVLAEAKRYILEKETSDSQSELSDYLKKYLSSADAFLAQASEQRNSKEQRDS